MKRTPRWVTWAALVMPAWLPLLAQELPRQRTDTGGAMRRYVSDTTLAERDFPLLAAMLSDPAARAALAQQPQLAAMAKDRTAAMEHAVASCGKDAGCLLQSARLTDAQIADAAAVLQTMQAHSAAIIAFETRHMQPKEAFVPAADSNDAAGELAGAWRRAAAGINRMIDVYSGVEKPRYPLIDSMSLDPSRPSFVLVVRDLLDTADLPSPPMTKPSLQQASLFFEAPMQVAIRLMMANGRDEAGREWPLNPGLNASAVRLAHGLGWSRYPYSLILVPGAGLEYEGSAISPGGRERVRLAVQAYREGLAPFILVSGGYVHPSQTPYCEALEMRRYLIEVYGIPASAILVDPHARHTTTNVRNAARQVFWYGLPPHKPMVIVSDRSQVDYIENPNFAKRNQVELGYEPAHLGKRLNPERLEATPDKASLLIDPTDPLDP